MMRTSFGFSIPLALLLAAVACQKDPPASNAPGGNGLPIEDNGTVGDRQDPSLGGRSEGDGANNSYDPCGGKSCGESCQICPPDDGTCVETAVVKQCDAEGQCSADAPTC